jgi:hypothetical protein
MAHDVFISHSTRNKSVADAVCAALEHAGIRCWVAPRDVLPGRSFAGEITRAINQSKAMVLIFSSDSNNSEQILREVQLAANAHLHIIQFRIEDVTPNDDLQYYLSTPHWLDAMTAPLESHLERLETSLKILLAPHGERAATGINDSLSTDGSIIAESSGTAEKDDQGGSIEAQAVPGTLSESAAPLPSPVAPLTIEGKEKVTDQAADPVKTNTSPTIFAATAADKKPIPAGNKEIGIGRRVLIGGAAASVLALVLWAYLKSRNDAGNRQPAAPAIAAEVSPPGLAPSVQSKPSTIRQQSGMNPGISFVNMNTVFKNYSRTKEAEKEINDARDMAKQEYDERAGTYKKGLEDYINCEWAWWAKSWPPFVSWLVRVTRLFSIIVE